MIPFLVDETEVYEALRTVVDPELDCNIVDLGLVYGLVITGSRVLVQMTLTTPGCPMHESLTLGAKTAVLGVEGVESVEVEIVWDPPWHPGLSTEYGRARLGLR